MPQAEEQPTTPAAQRAANNGGQSGDRSGDTGAAPSAVETLSGSRVESLSGSKGQSADSAARHAGGLGPGVDVEVGKAVADAGLATPEEVEYCREQQKNSSDPMQRSLADLLVENNFITPNQAKRVRGLIEQKRTGRIPGFTLIAEAGRGAMAKVYKAKQNSLDRIVAVKVLPKKVSDNPDFVDRFYKEGRAAAKLGHNNIVQAFDVGSTPDGYHYFVMEWLEGPSLYDMMQPPPTGTGKKFSEAEAIDIGIQMARALSHAHKRGMIHRDVKPKNIVLAPSGTAKLTDLGLAREKDDKQAAESEAGKAYGTPYYISPEQVRGEVDIDYRADIYSLGATLYHLVTGRPPFGGDSPSAVMFKHLREPLVPPDHVNHELTPGVSEIIEVAMKKDRDERYQNTEDLLEDLQAVAAGDRPIHARQVVDFASLAALETHGQTVDLNPADRPSPWQDSGVIALLAVAGLSLVANLLLLAVVLAQ